MIHAHGKTYETIEQAEARWNALEDENQQFGYSDGRVTEQVLIREAIDEACEPEVPGKDEEPQYEIVKNEYEMACEHPLCEQLHQRFMEQETVTYMASYGLVSQQVTETVRYHNTKRVDWVIADKRTGMRADSPLDDVYETKREAKAVLDAYLRRQQNR